MNREVEFKKVKEMIKEYYKDAECGLYDTRNLVGDKMTTIFHGEYFTLDICYYWSYFEVFGTSEKEFKELEKLYDELSQEVNKE